VRFARTRLVYKKVHNEENKSLGTLGIRLSIPKNNNNLERLGSKFVRIARARLVYNKVRNEDDNSLESPGMEISVLCSGTPNEQQM
jgi:hypothetical protein